MCVRTLESIRERMAHCPSHLLLHLNFALVSFFLIGLMDLLPLSGIESLQPLLQVSEIQTVLLLNLLQNSIEGHTQFLLLLLQTLT